MEDPVVVVGLSFRLPQEAFTEEGFWDILCSGRSTMTEVPADRFNIDGYYSPDRNRLDTVQSQPKFHRIHQAKFVSAYRSTFQVVTSSRAMWLLLMHHSLR